MDHSLENRIIEFMDRAEPMLREYEAHVAERDAYLTDRRPPEPEQAEIGQGQAAQELATAPSEAAPQASDPDLTVDPLMGEPVPAAPAEPPEAQDGQTDHTAPGAAI